MGHDSGKLETLNSQHSLQALQQVPCPYQAAQVVWALSKHLSRSLSLPGTPLIWECLYKCLGKEELRCLVNVKNFLKDWVVYLLSLKESPLGASLILRSFSQRVKWVTLKEIATQQAPSHFPLLSSFFTTETWTHRSLSVSSSLVLEWNICAAMSGPVLNVFQLCFPFVT